MNKEETEFLEVARRILNDGIETTDRTGVGVKFIPGISLKYDLTNNKLPLWTTRKINWKNQWTELIWFLRGQTDVKYLTDRGVNIWNSWTKTDGTIGPGYGKQWRSWDRFIDKSYIGVHGEERNYKLNQPIDQFSNLVEGIKKNPASRRHIVSLWNPVDVNECALPPCFTSGTLINTTVGYKKIEDIQINDIVLNANGCYDEVNEVWATPYQGELFHIKTNYNNQTINCTPNHPILVKEKGYIEAKSIQVGDFVGIPRNKDSKIPTFEYSFHPSNYKNPIVKKWQPNKDDYFTMGYFLGDGWHNGKNKICFAINNKDKQTILPQLRKSIKICQKPEKKKKNCYTYETKSLKWQSVLKDFGRGASNKIIPYWILQSPVEFIEAFLQGYKKADGCSRNKEKRFTTVSMHIAYGLQLLYAKIGNSCGIGYRQRKPKKIIENRLVNQKNLYEVSSSSYIKNGYGVCEEDYLWIKVKEKTITSETTTVYNFGVANSHTYTAFNVANHNCHGDVIQFIVDNNRGLHCIQYQRSADFCVGACPWQYTMLTHIVAKLTNTVPTSLTVMYGHCHIYLNQLDAVKEQLSRTPTEFPTMDILKPLSTILDVESLELKDIVVSNYNHQKFIKFPIAV